MKTSLRRFVALLALIAIPSGIAFAQPAKPNILVIWGDDIGWQNVSAYGMGTMGYTTPNIDSIGLDGIRFTDRSRSLHVPPAALRSSRVSIRSAPA